MSMKTMTAPKSPRARVMAVLQAFIDLPANEEYGVMTGEAEDHSPAVVVEMQGKHYGLMVDEARKLASIMEDAMRTYPNDPAAASVPDFIMALRHAANMAGPQPKKEPSVEYAPEVAAQMAADPKLAEAVRDFAATARQAMQDVADGKYADFGAAMEARGLKPERVDGDGDEGYVVKKPERLQ